MQQYRHYIKWECWRHGMYSQQLREEQVKQSARCLSNPDIFASACDSVLNKWTNSSIHFITNPGINRRAWLGQASCCLQFGSSDRETKVAWFTLTELERETANNIAIGYIRRYLKTIDKQLCLNLI